MATPGLRVLAPVAACRDAPTTGVRLKKFSTSRSWQVHQSHRSVAAAATSKAVARTITFLRISSLRERRLRRFFPVGLRDFLEGVIDRFGGEVYGNEGEVIVVVGASRGSRKFQKHTAFSHGHSSSAFCSARTVYCARWAGRTALVQRGCSFQPPSVIIAGFGPSPLRTIRSCTSAALAKLIRSAAAGSSGGLPAIGVDATSSK